MCLFKRVGSFNLLLSNRTGRNGLPDEAQSPSTSYALNWKGICITVAFLLLLFATVFAHFRYSQYQTHLQHQLSEEERAQPRTVAFAFLFGRLPPPPGPDAEKAEAVRQMALFAWENYASHALGARALCPLTRSPSDEATHYSTGTTLLEAMSTLLVLDLPEQYQVARRWALSMKIPRGDDGRHPLYVWPLVTRYMGSLLSCYALTGDEQLLAKARQFAELVRPAFMSKGRYSLLWVNGSLLIIFVIFSLRPPLQPSLWQLFRLR